MNLALFDFDGTITVADTFTPFIHFAVPRARVLRGSIRLLPLIAGYRLGRVPATRMRQAIVKVAFEGSAERDVDRLGERYAQSLADVLRPEALERIAWHRHNGDCVVVVSASLAPYLRSWCAERGLELICAELESRDGVLTGRYLGGDCTGEEKARRVLARYDLSRYREIYAYGDTEEDEALLGLASKRFYRWRERP
jgi:HAD superfamily hydrolase (TIGR01490 family)